MLTISTTHPPATDLGYLLHKHPDKLQAFDLPFGKAHVFYPHAEEHLCTAALMMEVDPIDLTHKGSKSSTTPDFLLQNYVNDRPYTASSHLSVAIAKVFGTALSGKCEPRPELVNTPLPLKSTIASVHSRYGSDLIHRLFEPLDYEVETETLPLDTRFPEWGDAPHHNVTLTSDSHTLRQLLVHLYVLLPVLDNQKHYWVANDEADKLVRFGQGWLESHPARDIISRRYLRHRANLVGRAQEGLAQAQAETSDDDQETDDQPEQDAPQAPRITESDLERPARLQELRTQAVITALTDSGAASVLDLGCGTAQLTTQLLKVPQFTKVTAVEVSLHSIRRARRELKQAGHDPQDSDRVDILHGSLIYRDPRIGGADAAVAMEVIEHIDVPKLDAFEDAILAAARPKTLVITTPNREYNVLFEHLDKPLRHRDHRFEWTREEFKEWAAAAAERNGYTVRYEGIGVEDPERGHPTQMAVFTIQETSP